MHVEAKSVLHQQVRVELNPGGSDTTAAHGLSSVKTETETDGINKGVKVRTHIYVGWFSENGLHCTINATIGEDFTLTSFYVSPILPIHLVNGF